MDTIKLTIDGRSVEVPAGVTVLEAARSAGIYIPTLCAHPDLEPYGACRLCMVEIENMRGLPTACTTPATNGMVVRTDSTDIRWLRQMVLQEILSNHPSECLVCNRRKRCGPNDVCLRNVAVNDRCVTCPKNGQCELQTVVEYLGITELTLPHFDRQLPVDDSNPFFNFDRNKCILCARCVRTCNEITCVGAIDLVSRSFETRVATASDKPLFESICQSCGECVAHCPTGALYPRRYTQPEEETLTTCPYCGVGCGMYLGTKDGKIVSVRGDTENPTSKGRLCVKGRFGVQDFIQHPDRLKNPLVKRNGKFIETTWDEALDLVSRKLAGYHGDRVAVISSARSTNEDNYIIQKFTRAVLGTNNIDHCARLCHSPSVAGLATSFGSGAMTNSIGEIEHAACIFSIGSNTTATHPVIGFDVKNAVRKGATLIVANPREINLVRHAEIWLQHKPGTDVALLMGVMRVIVDEHLEDTGFISERCENFPAFKASLQNFDLDTVAQITGVPKDLTARAARVYATTRPASILYAMGITQHSHGTDNVMAIANLAMLTGNIGKPSTGVNPLRGQNNVQGACDMGALPNVFPAYQPVNSPDAIARFEKAWQCKLSPKPGLTLTEIFDAAVEGKIKALYLIGENPMISDADIKHVRKSLEALDFLVVQDIFLTETAELADVVLPACSFAEKDGTFTSTERRVQRVRKVIPPVGNSQPDWWITCQIARRMGAKGFDFETPSDIMDEIARLAPSYGGISYSRLDKGSLQWPCPTPEHPGTPILHTTVFSRGKGQFIPLVYKPPVELPDSQYPLMLTTERSLFQYHTGTMTRRSKGLNTFRGEEMVEISPADALAFGINDGDRIKVISRRGEVRARAKITRASPAGVISMSFHFAESPTNMVTSPALDPVAKIPEFKVAAVRIEKVPA